jgi:hypothetical protein
VYFAIITRDGDISKVSFFFSNVRLLVVESEIVGLTSQALTEIYQGSRYPQVEPADSLSLTPRES